VLKTPITHYTVTPNSYAGGKIVHLVEFTAGNFPDEDAEVTVDAYGYPPQRLAYDGTAVIANPVGQMRHFLCNFAVGRSKGYIGAAPWETTASIVDSTSWDAAETWVIAKGLESSRFLGGPPRQVDAIFSEWLESVPGLKAFWNADGKIALKILSTRWPGYWNGTSQLLRKENELENSFRYECDTNDLTRKISVRYLHDEVQGDFLRSLDVQDLSVDVLADSTLDMYWSPARQV
jgi:hypothetical protein